MSVEKCEEARLSLLLLLYPFELRCLLRLCRMGSGFYPFHPLWELRYLDAPANVASGTSPTTCNALSEGDGE